MLDLLRENDIRTELQDERLAGWKVTAKFTGTLRKDQKAAVREMLKHDDGVLCAPTAFGKTVAAALIARRSGNEVNANFPFQKIGKSAPPRGCTSSFNPVQKVIAVQNLDNYSL